MKARFAILVGLAACGGATAAGTPAPQRRDPKVILAEEIASIPSTASLFDLIRRLRPAWRLEGPPTALLTQQEGSLVVYVDGTRFGNAQSLHQMQSAGVQAIRYYSPSEAEGRFGPGHLKGAIEIVTHQR